MQANVFTAGRFLRLTSDFRSQCLAYDSVRFVLPNIDFRLCLWSVHEQKGFWRLLAKMINRIMFILRKKSGLCRYPLFQVTIFLI
ncbi:unnamed protein product [Acanthoscelides obtectus]|uniref:Uncharacterized protein n=1 Tax=Acanthoscelides obtectus TaxID=200917 RepID=A0A9P0PAU8_ACAOB|nr:unnamed protein product [Acanthoscelides obtectus]CAK1635263.1 hypothetical protein AOBTE_LOCUS9164 [Acanthoscelides obtectus]